MSASDEGARRGARRRARPDEHERRRSERQGAQWKEARSREAPPRTFPKAHTVKDDRNHRVGPWHREPRRSRLSRITPRQRDPAACSSNEESKSRSSCAVSSGKGDYDSSNEDHTED